MPSTAKECRELCQRKCRGIVREFHIVWRVVTLNNNNLYSAMESGDTETQVARQEN